MQKLLIALIAAVQMVLLGRAEESRREIVVSPDGITPHEALAKIRAARKKGDSGVWTIRVKEGFYSFTQPLSLTPEDGGAEGGGAMKWIGEGRVVFSGGARIAGWKDRGDGVWAAKAPKNAAGEIPFFTQLWVDGKRADLARFPNTGYLKPKDGAQVAEKDALGKPTGAFLQAMVFTNDEVRALGKLGEGERKYIQVTSPNYFLYCRAAMGEYNSQSNAITFKTPTRVSHGDSAWCKKGLVRFENVRTALDAPGEWFYDYDHGEILYRPRVGEDMTCAEVIAPTGKLTTLLSLAGDPERRNFVSDVSFERLTFAHTDMTHEKDEKFIVPSRPKQSAVWNDAAVHLKGAHRVTFVNCRVEHTGSHGFKIEDGSSHNMITNCVIRDVGAGGIVIGAEERRIEDRGRMLVKGAQFKRRVIAEKELNPIAVTHNVVDDCLITGGSRVTLEGAGVVITHASDTKVLHCEIADFYYSGVSVGYSWGYRGSAAQRNEIAFNHIHDLGKGVMSDLAGVYTLGTSFGTRIHDNVIHDIRFHIYGGWGIYCDEGTEGVTIENNLVYNTHDGGFFQHYGTGNLVRNNIFAFNERGYAIQVGRPTSYYKGQEIPSSLNLVNNICFVKSGGLISRGTDRIAGVFAANLWHAAAGVSVKMDNCTNYVDWVRSRREVCGVFADPQFVDAENLDFRLKPSSPAFKLGFQAFDFSRAGKRK